VSTAPGELALVLHTHLPHLRGHGVWPVGEEWLFQAWATSWLPVTRALERLADDGHRDVLTLSVSPPVAHQTREPRMARELAGWLAAQVWRAEEQRWHASMGPEVQALGPHWWTHFQRLADYHDDVERRGGLTAVWAALAAEGVIELLGGPATHPYLPLVADPALIDAQLASGLDEHADWAGERARGLWPPELGHRPRSAVADATAEPMSVDGHGTPDLPRVGPELAGLEEHYARHGITHVVVDGPTLVRAAGGAERDWTVRPAATDPRAWLPDEVLHDGVLIGESDVVAFGRDLSVAYHVWSPTAGYPGDPWYRDLHATGGFGVHPSWRVTDRALPPDAKAPYVPSAARAALERDAAHLVGVLHDVLDPRPGGIVVAAYDTELLGHWWHEGADWLEATLRLVHADPGIRTTTLASRLERRPATRRLTLGESSWGYAKGHASWVTPETRPIWVTLRAAEARARATLAGGRGGEAARAAIARQLALLSASDWAFMTTRGGAAGYAAARVATHRERLDRWCDAILAGPEAERALAHELGDADDGPRVTAPFVSALDPDGA
jgi:1,4-alpha-glucan branching enzyme